MLKNNDTVIKKVEYLIEERNRLIKLHKILEENIKKLNDDSSISITFYNGIYVDVDHDKIKTYEVKELCDYVLKELETVNKELDIYLIKQ